MARWCRLCLSVAGPFVCRCLTSPNMLRFHIPLIEPDVRNYRIRLSEKTHGVAYGRLAVRWVSRTRPNSSCSASSGYRLVPVPRTLCLAHWSRRVPLHRPVGVTDRTEAKVVGPSQHLAVNPTSAVRGIGSRETGHFYPKVATTFSTF